MINYCSSFVTLAGWQHGYPDMFGAFILVEKYKTKLLITQQPLNPEKNKHRIGVI